jgi:DNA-directed RNA polymerase specialized sigma24 family protein/ribosome-associated translation inhibitor RaiA
MMEIFWEYSGCDPDHEREIERCWERIQQELEANMGSLPDPPTELRIVIDHEDEAPEWCIKAVLHVPGRSLAVRATANDVQAAIDDLLTGLSGEIDTLQDLPVRVSRRMEGLESIVAFLESSHLRGRRDAFMSFITPVVASLASYAHRELQLREIEGAVAGAALSTPDVLDEVLVRAWQQFADRPGALSLDGWILRLVDEVLDSASEEGPIESLDQEQPVPSKEPLPSQRGYWEEQATYPESIERHELLPGAPEADAWDDADLEVKQENTARLLAGIPRQRRQALLLCAVHGFSEAEVADFQDRAKTDVRKDIDAATAQLTQQLTNK